jgi:hypothetical protein
VWDDLRVVIRVGFDKIAAVKRLTCIFSVSLLATMPLMAGDGLRASLEATYNSWRNAMIRKDAATWQRVTAEHRVVEVRNRIVSEQRPFPTSVFEIPAAPPALEGLDFLEAARSGPTAKAIYFGKINFGVGGTPTDNLLVLSFVQGRTGWTYDRAEFVNLSALPEVRRELVAGDLRYIREVPEARPSGQVPPTPAAVAPAPFIAKVYVFCPGREVQVHVNKMSRHRFANEQEAEIVIGGAREGLNEVQFSIRNLEGATGKDAVAIRVYLLSTIEGVMPIKVYEYLVQEGGEVRPFATENFNLDAATAERLRGR